MKITAILTVRNEAAFLLEWLAHHRAVGITDFLVFSNDCQDGTDTMLDRLAELGEIEHHPNLPPYDKGGIQFTALKKAGKLDIVKQADWILPIDVDEFVNIHVGDGTIPDLLTSLPDATAVTLTWRLFGNADVIHFEDKLITQQFTRAAPRVMHWPWRASMFKTLYKNDKVYRGPGVHRPRGHRDDKLDQSRWFDCNGDELDDQFKTRRIFSNFGRDNYALAQLNHYPLGAMENYIVKADRGRAVHSDHMLDVDYWVERNYMAEEDTTIHRYADRVQAELDRLKSDDKLNALHQAAVIWRKARFNQLMEDEPYRALFGRLLQTPPSRPVPQNAARFMVRFANMARARDAQSGD